MRITARFENVPTPAKPSTQPKAASADSPAARNLALAHYLKRMIDRGIVADFTAAARMLGVSQPRLTHLMGLLLLAPEIQAAILFDELAFADKELRALARIADWGEQKTIVAHRGTRRP